MTYNDVLSASRTAPSAFTRRAFIATGIGATLAAAGCSGGKSLPTPGGASGEAGSGKGEIQFWLNHSADEAKQFTALIKEFQTQFPDITVKMLNIADGPQYYTKVNTAAVGGKLPDVFYARTFDVASNVAKGWCTSMTPLVERDKDEVKPDDFWPAQVEQMTVDGQLYGLPYDFSNFAVYYNKTMFEAEGVPLPTGDWDWPKYWETAAPFAKKDGKRQTRWGSNGVTSNWFMMGVFKANGGDTFSADLKSAVVNNPANIATLSALADQMKAGVAPTAQATPAGVDPFSAQLVAMSIDGSWSVPQTRTNINNKFEWDVVKLPKGSSGKREVSAAGGSWAIAKSSKNQEAAWTFVKFLANADSQKKLIVDPTRSIPGRQSSAKQWTEVALSKKAPPTNVEVFSTQLADDAVNWAYPKFWAEFNTSWTNRLTSLGVKGDPAEILAQVEKETNTAAKRYT
ncbi:MAG: ABC transporter substrate-binding protein [Propionibacteriaceae bacterium]